MAEMNVIETLESAWFFSNVFSAKTKSKSKSEPEPTSDSSEPTTPTNQTPKTQPKPLEIPSPTNSPQEKSLIGRAIEFPASAPVVAEVSRSPRRREEDERRRMRRRQRSYSNNNRGLNLEGEVEFCRGGLGELKSNAELKNEKAIKRHLKTWALVVASSSVAHQNRPMLALCC